MTTQDYRISLVVYPETGATIQKLMSKTSRRKSTVLKEALEKGLRQMEREQIQLETLAENGY